MRKSMRPVGMVERRALSANHRWKERWIHWIMRGTVAAAAAHLLLLLFWPRWNVAYDAPEERLEMVQIEPITNPGATSGPEEERTITLPNVEEEESAQDGGGVELTEVELADLLDRLPEREMDQFSPVLTAGSYARPAAPLPPPLVLEQSPLEIDPSTFLATDVWPLIRNPSAMMRFLDAGTRVETPPADLRDRFLVTVAIWINERGYVEWAEIRESSGQPGLDQIAVAAFNEVALFRPARNQSGPVPVGVTFTLLFDGR